MRSWVQIVVIAVLILLSIWAWRKFKSKRDETGAEDEPVYNPIAGIPVPKNFDVPDPEEIYPSNWDKLATPPIVGDNTTVYAQPVY